PERHPRGARGGGHFRAHGALRPGAEMTTTIPSAQREVTLPIRGMTCAACVSHVEKALRSVPGVRDARVNLATERATVRYDSRAAGLREMADAVAASGYATPAATTTLEIDGLLDATDAARVEQALVAAPGVVRDRANLARHAVAVEHFPTATDPGALA